MRSDGARQGPLAGLRVVEFAGIGPGPHCAMLFADMGAEVLRIDRAGGNGWPNPIADRGRSTISLDLRSEEGVATARDAAAQADMLIEGYRPGVMERLGLGPDALLALNPRLIYGRMTGWGQEGPLARSVGHDITYVAITGALGAMGRAGEAPPLPLNLVGDFGGGSMFLAFGMLAALWERERSGKGQVVDAAIVDGVASLMGFFAGLDPKQLSVERGQNLLGGAAPFYRCYTCADGREIAVGPLEPQFYRDFLDRIGAPADLYEAQNDRANWAGRAEQLAALFKTKTAREWCALLEGTDACVAPVLTLDEAPHHPHLAARDTYVAGDGGLQPAPAPRLSRTPGAITASVADGEATLARWREAG